MVKCVTEVTQRLDVDVDPLNAMAIELSQHLREKKSS